MGRDKSYGNYIHDEQYYKRYDDEIDASSYTVDELKDMIHNAVKGFNDDNVSDSYNLFSTHKTKKKH